MSSRVLQVRVDPETYEALSALAAADGITVSELSRRALVKLLEPPPLPPPKPVQPAARTSRRTVVVADLPAAPSGPKALHPEDLSTARYPARWKR